MTQLLIGLAGAARSGKTTAAQHLAVLFGFIHYALAQPLKTMLAQGFNLGDAHLEGALKEQQLPWLGKSPRELMQLLGTEFGRGMVHPDLWLLLAEQNLDNLINCYPGGRGVVISDLRFENETAFVRQRGGVVVHILRPDAEQIRAHSSESGIAIHDHDLVIDNDGDVADLLAHVEDVLRTVSYRATRSA